MRARVSRETGRAVEVISCYEAGYDGFWLHRHKGLCALQGIYDYHPLRPQAMARLEQLRTALPTVESSLGDKTATEARLSKYRILGSFADVLALIGQIPGPGIRRADARERRETPRRDFEIHRRRFADDLSGGNAGPGAARAAAEALAAAGEALELVHARARKFRENSRSKW